MLLFYSSDRRHPLFDFIYKDEKGHFHAFQATVGNTHSAKREHIQALERRVGGAAKLSLYYLVLPSKYDAFMTDPVDPRIQSEKGHKASCQVFHVVIPNPT